MVDLLPSFDAIPLFPKKKKRLCQIQKRKGNEKKEFRKSQKVHLITQ